MLNFGISEVLLIAVIALVFVGPERLPEMVRFLGRQYGKLMRASNELRRAFVLETDRADLDKRNADLRRRRKEALERARALHAERSAPAPPDPEVDAAAETAAAPDTPAGPAAPTQGET